MIDRPGGPDLLRAMSRALSEDVVANTTGQAQYSARIVANLCLILAREHELDPPQAAQALTAIQEVVSKPVSDLNEGIAALDQLIESESIGDDEAIYQTLLADVERRLDLARPGYR